MAVEHLCLGCMSYLENPNEPCPNCGWVKTQKNSVSQLQTGYTLTNENHTEKYVIGRALGQGGFGISYLAWHANRGEKVVVKEYFPTQLVYRDRDFKVISSNAKNDELFQHGLDNFLKEAYNMLEFSNDPNVVNVKNFFQANNTAYIVMEFIDGKTLKKIIENSGGRIPLDDVLDKLSPIAAVLKRMHKPKMNTNGQILRQPLLHRDISPDNIMFTRDGFVKLLDFGAARNLDDDKTGIIRTGYSPPEQFVSNDSVFIQGPWTDVYALAATIYHAVTGQLPLDSISRLGSPDSLVLPSSLGVKLEPFQEKALLKGLAPDYRKRYQTVSEFMNALRPVATSSLNEEKLLVPSMVLSSIGGLMAISLFIFSLNTLVGESILEMDFIISFFAGMVSTICLGTLTWDLFQIYKRQQPKFLYDVFHQDAAFWSQVICAIIFLFLAFIYTKSWDDSFIAEIQITVFLNTDLYSDDAETLVNVIILIYALASLSAFWLGRKLLRKNI